MSPTSRSATRALRSSSSPDRVKKDQPPRSSRKRGSPSSGRSSPVAVLDRVPSMATLPDDQESQLEKDLDVMLDADEGLVEEEERLQRERQSGLTAATTDSKAKGKGGKRRRTSPKRDQGAATDEDYVPELENPSPAQRSSFERMDDSKLVQLNQLLDQTDMFSKFLSEQMQEIESSIDCKPKSSRSPKKKGGKGGQASKSPTQDFLELVKGGELRDYQIKGVKWLISLWQNGLNGILADQMGLGKTVQAIGFMAHLWEMKVTGPFLVVAPLSTLANWVNEFKRWTPDIPVLLYHGSAEERETIRLEKLKHASAGDASFPVIVTSYEICIRDAKHLQKYSYKYMVVDEGHRLKNFDCRLIRELRNYQAANKLLLTGTPLQNNLAELWSLLNFLLPEVFVSLQDFEGWFDFSEVSEDDQKAQEQHTMIVSKLHSILKPFLLRRLKVDVLISLPMKKEVILYPTMAKHQKKLNKELGNKTIAQSMVKLASENRAVKVDLGKLKNILMQMRKNCNHPDLITGDYDGSLTLPTAAEMVEQCGKMQLLERLLNKLESQDSSASSKENKGKGERRVHKVLIFSQMTKMLDLLECYLEERGNKVCRIDGGIPWAERQEFIDKFNKEGDEEYRYFLLSTRAGGLGINLTAADTVIIYDSDWNPQQDLQAMDRCHRIGQTRPVLVFRMITANSVEEKMLARAESKLKLERLVIKKGAFLHNDDATQKASALSVDEIREILKSEMSGGSGGDSPSKKSGCDISDKDLDMLLDRSDLEKGTAIKSRKGRGFEVLAQKTGAGILSGVNN